MFAFSKGRSTRGILIGAVLVFAMGLSATVAAGQATEDDPPVPASADRPSVLVAGFSLSGSLLLNELNVKEGLGWLTEALLADTLRTVSPTQIERACETIGSSDYLLEWHPELRLSVAKNLGVAFCVKGWACSFGNRVILILEVIDPSRGLPGKVYRTSAKGMESIPGMLEELLEAAGLLGARIPATDRKPLPELSLDDLLTTYKDYDCDVLRRGPYLIFVQKSGDQPVLVPAARLGDDLERFLEGFYGLFGEPLDLPRLEDRPRSHERVLRVLVVTKRETFTAVRMPQEVDGFYSPRDQWLTLFIDEDDVANTERIAALRRKLVSLATHQLVHYLSRFAVEADGGEEIPWTDPTFRSKSIWLSVGLAELMAGAVGAEGEFDPAVLNSDRKREWQQSIRQKSNDWSLVELLSIRSLEDMRRRAKRKGLAYAARLSSLFYAQSTALCHFLWNHDEGKYRNLLIAMMKKELHGESGPEVTQAVFGLEENDWQSLEQEWRAAFEE